LLAQDALTQRLDAATRAHASVYVGQAGVALFWLRLSQLRAREGDARAAAALLARADAALDGAEAARRPPHGHTFLEGDSGVHAARAAVAAAAGRPADAAAAAACVAALAPRVARAPPGDCELLYGRAGFLHACLVARAAAGAAVVPDAVLSSIASDIIAAGVAAADARGPTFASRWGLLYTWHGADYLGAAHGLAGIVQTLLHVECELQRSSAGAWQLPAPERVRAATLALAGSLLPSGNLPTRYESKHGGDDSHEDRLVQWCHGAPGLLLLAAATARHSSAEGVPAAATDAAADCVWCDDDACLVARCVLARCRGTHAAVLAPSFPAGAAGCCARAWGCATARRAAATRCLRRGARAATSATCSARAQWLPGAQRTCASWRPCRTARTACSRDWRASARCAPTCWATPLRRACQALSCETGCEAGGGTERNAACAQRNARRA
jgi:hypothetical protein